MKTLFGYTKILYAYLRLPISTSWQDIRFSTRLVARPLVVHRLNDSFLLSLLHITKTRLYNIDPLKPHFYIVKVGFTGVYIIFLISAQNIYCGYSLEPPRRGGSNPLRKHAYSNILKILSPKKWKISGKNSDIFHISAQNIDCGYSLEPPRRGGSNEYPQSMSWTEIRKIMYTPVNPSFTI